MDDRKFERIAKSISGSANGIKCQYLSGEGIDPQDHGRMTCSKFIGMSKVKNPDTQGGAIEDEFVQYYNHVPNEGGKYLCKLDRMVFCAFGDDSKESIQLGESEQETSGYPLMVVEDEVVQEYNRFQVPHENEAVFKCLVKEDDGRVFCDFEYLDVDEKGGPEEFAKEIGGELVQSMKDLHRI